MRKYNTFAEHVGMKLITRSAPHQSVSGALEKLAAIGFDPVRMPSASYD